MLPRSRPERAAAPTEDASTRNTSGRRLLRNVAANYLALGLGFATSLVLTPLVLHHLGTADYGVWVVLTAIGSYLGIIDTGVGAAVVREVAASLATSDDRRMQEALATARAFFLVTGGVSLAVALALIPVFGALFHPPPDARGASLVALALVGVTTACQLGVNWAAAALFGGGYNDRQTLVATGIATATAVAQLVVVLLGGGLVGLFLATAVGAGATYAVLTGVARRSGFAVREQSAASWTVFRRLLSHGVGNALVYVAWTIGSGLNVLLIGLLLPVRRVTPYDIALSTANLSGNVSRTGTRLLLPNYAHHHVLEDSEPQFVLYSRAVLLSMAIGVGFLIGLTAFGRPMLHLWLGRVPARTYPTMIILNATVVLGMPAGQAAVLLMGRGRSLLLARLALPSAVITLGLGALGTWLWGPVGTAAGALPQVLIIESIVLPMVVCRELDCSYRRFARWAVAPLAVPVAVGTGTAALLAWTVGASSAPLAPGEAVVTCLLAWGALMVVLTRTDPVIGRLVRDGMNRLSRSRAAT